MALGATIYKVDVQISDLDRGYYQGHKLTLAKHPSETEQRLMLRLLAYIIFADELLDFGKGISTDDEPVLWRKTLSGEIEQWIDLGTSDEKRLRKACARAQEVVLIAYGDRNIDVWWPSVQKNLSSLKKLQIWQISDQQLAELSKFAQRNMQIQALIQDGEIMLTDDEQALTLVLQCLKALT